MAGYLGSVPVPQATQHRETFTATAGQTTFNTAGYTPQFIDVYLNGVHLSPADVTATNGSDVVLSACLVNDIVDVVSYTPFEVASQTFTGTTTMDAATFSGNVGIGTSPATAYGRSLHIHDTGTSGANLRLTDSNTGSGTGNGFELITINADSYLINRENGPIHKIINGNTVQKIDATGAITAPKQPAFLAQPASTQSNFGADGNNDTVVFGTERFDVGANFASNTFTAPVTGKYQLSVNLYLTDLDSAANYYQMTLITSNRSYFYAYDVSSSDSDPSRFTFQINALVDMDASDTASVGILQSGGTAQTDINVDSFFSGFLAC